MKPIIYSFMCTLLLLSQLSCTDSGVMTPETVMESTDIQDVPPSVDIGEVGELNENPTEPTKPEDATSEDVQQSSLDAGGEGEEDATKLVDVNERANDSDLGNEEMDSQPLDERGPPPSILSAETLPVPDWGLAVLIRVQTEHSTTVETTVFDGVTEWILPAASVTKTGNSGEFDVLVLGLEANTSYVLAVTATGSGIQQSEPIELTWTTESLPENFAILEWTEGDGIEPLSDGFISFAVADVTPGASQNEKSGFLVVMDLKGNVVGFKAWPTQQIYARRSPSGTWFSLQGKTSVREWNAKGELLWQLTGQDAGVDSFHHELLPLPTGELAILGLMLKSITGYPEGTLDVVGDTVMELNPEDLSLQVNWNLFDILDPFRTPGGFSSNFWKQVYKGVSSQPKDWTHANSLFLTDNESAYVISLRNQNLVAQFDRATGELQWALGSNDPGSEEDDSWPWLTISPEDRLPNQQHSASLTSEGTLMLYDNGNDIQTSYVAEYDIDAEAMTASLIWLWTDESLGITIHSRNGGNAEPVTGNRALLTHSQLPKIPGDGSSPSYSLIQMVRKDGKGAQKEWDLTVLPKAEERSVRVYRAHFLPSLYPQNKDY